MRFYSLLACLLVPLSASLQIAQVGKQLRPWKKGYLDLHHINTGVGDAAFYIFPDGTTMLFDAGEIPPTDKRAFTPRNAPPRPDTSRNPYEWIAYYIQKVAPDQEPAIIDYAVVSHFHDDHIGGWYKHAPVSSSNDFQLTGLSGVGELLKIGTLFDRGYPEYNYPDTTLNARLNLPQFNRTFQNYIHFQRSKEKIGMNAKKLHAGSVSQLKCLKATSEFSHFNVRVVKSGKDVWSGEDSSTINVFPSYNSALKSTWPDENSLSVALLITYGPFKYFTGGDCAGNLMPGDPSWKDVETPVASVVGSVDVATLDHHGNRDAVNKFQVKTFQPRVWIGQSWSADHPGHEVLLRITSKFLYPGKRDIFATNMLDANRQVIGSLIDSSYRSTQGHIVVRVLPGGSEYYVIILDDASAEMLVKSIHGPYYASIKTK